MASRALELEVARVSWIRHAGMTFRPDSWAVYIMDGVDRELVYLSSILQVRQTSELADATSHYVQVFRFSFQQLRVRVEANRLLVDAVRFQNLLNIAPAAVTGTFSPSRCSLQGRWIWTPKQFESWAQVGKCRSVHMSNTSSESQLIFVFR